LQLFSSLRDGSLTTQHVSLAGVSRNYYDNVQDMLPSHFITSYYVQNQPWTKWFYNQTACIQHVFGRQI